MNHGQIHIALQKKGYNWNTASEAIGKSAATLYKVCHRKQVSRRVALSICVLLDKDVMEVFPDVPNYHGDAPESARKKLVDSAKEKLEAAGLAA